MSCFPCTLQLKYREVYEKSKAQINMDPEAHEIRAAKEAYKNITNVRVFTRGIRKNHFLFIIDSRLTQHTFLILAWLQEEIWSHEKQVDLDSRQTRLPQCCQELPAAERCELVLLFTICVMHIVYFVNIQQCCSYFAPTGWVQVWQRDDERLCDPCGWWQVNSPGYEE